MYYRSSFKSRRHRAPYGTIATTTLIVLVLLSLFAYGIWSFRFGSRSDSRDESTDSIASVLTPSPVSSSTLATTVTTTREAKLRDVSGGTATGRVERENDDGRYFLKLKAALPGIDRESQNYEAWLVRQVPYDYFSVGTFVTNEEGEWVLEWSGAEGKYDGYTQVVVTREANDGNQDPSGHILEGEFE